MNKNDRICKVLELSCVKNVAFFHRKKIVFIIIKKTRVFQVSDVKCLHCIAREKDEIPDKAIYCGYTSESYHIICQYIYNTEYAFLPQNQHRFSGLSKIVSEMHLV